MTRVVVAGTHSTGKTTLLDHLEVELNSAGHDVARIPGFAAQAIALGFPKLKHQTAECTEWIIAASAQAIARATLVADVVLVDHSAFDPMAYYLAALDHAQIEPDANTVHRLSRIAAAHTAAYNLLIATVLDPTVPLGAHRDGDLSYRATVDRHLHRLLTTLQIPHRCMTNANSERQAAVAAAVDAAKGGSQ